MEEIVLPPIKPLTPLKTLRRIASLKSDTFGQYLVKKGLHFRQELNYWTRFSIVGITKWDDIPMQGTLIHAGTMIKSGYKYLIQKGYWWCKNGEGMMELAPVKGEEVAFFEERYSPTKLTTNTIFPIHVYRLINIVDGVNINRTKEYLFVHVRSFECEYNNGWYFDPPIEKDEYGIYD